MKQRVVYISQGQRTQYYIIVYKGIVHCLNQECASGARSEDASRHSGPVPGLEVSPKYESWDKKIHKANLQRQVSKKAGVVTPGSSTPERKPVQGVPGSYIILIHCRTQPGTLLPWQPSVNSEVTYIQPQPPPSPNLTILLLFAFPLRFGPSKIGVLQLLGHCVIIIEEPMLNSDSTSVESKAQIYLYSARRLK